MSADPIAHKLGRIITRTLLSPSVRRIPGILPLYTELYLTGKQLMEKREVQYFQEHITPGMIIIDIGANVGFYTRLFSELVGDHGRVVAFEPDPLSFQILRKRLRGKTNTTLEQLALADREGEIMLRISKTNRADNRIHPHEGNVKTEETVVLLQTLDRYCESQSMTKIDAIKMDIQGAETKALRGMQNVLSTMKPQWMFIEFSPADLRSGGSSPEEFWSVLASYGYEPWEIDEKGKEKRIEDTKMFSDRVGDDYTNVVLKRL